MAPDWAPRLPRVATYRLALGVALPNSVQPLASVVAALVQSQGPTLSPAYPVFIVHFVYFARLKAEHRHGAKLAPPPSVSATYTVRTGCGDDVSRKTGIPCWQGEGQSAW